MQGYGRNGCKAKPVSQFKLSFHFRSRAERYVQKMFKLFFTLSCSTFRYIRRY